MMLEMIDACVRRGENFAFETTLSGRSYARMIPRWQAQGYWVTLVFLRVWSPEVAIARVRQRVQEGGHDVPEAVIRRRFNAGWHNFELLYRALVNEAIVYNV
jgi:predicted ABC-type ATPase